MAIKSQIDAVLNKKMDRSGFIKHIALGMVAMSGVGAALKVLSVKQEPNAANTGGYGSSAYGGADKNLS